MEEVYNFLKDNGTYYLGTIDDEIPRVRPFGTINMFENKLYIQTSKKKNVSKQLEKNNNFEICAYNGKEWIRVSGKLIEDDRIEAKKSMLDSYPDLRNIYDENDENTEVLFMSEVEAIISSFTDDDKKYIF